MNKSTRDIMGITGILGLLLLFIILIGVGPLITIASLNLLFNLQIAYTFWTWLAMIWIQMVSFGGIIAKLAGISKKLN